MPDDDARRDELLIRRARTRVVAAVLTLSAAWLVLVVAVIVGAAQSSGLPSSGMRLLGGAAITIIGGVLTVAAMLRALRGLKEQPLLPASSTAQRLRALDHIRRGLPVEDRDTNLARSLAARMATGRARIWAVVPVALMLVGVAIMFPGALLDTALLLAAALLLLLTAVGLRNADRAERFLARTDSAG